MKQRRLFLEALICALLFVDPAFGQTLNLKRIAANYLIEASGPPGESANLQVSSNLRLWLDVRENIEPNFNYSLDLSRAEGLYFRLVPTPEPAPQIRFMMIGDSMSSDCCGWGGAMPRFFKENATVINYSQPWTSSRVFLTSAEMDKMLLVQPNYVLMQFGYSDGGPDPNRHSTPSEFADNMRTLAQTVRGFNGIPIFITLHAARSWQQGKLIDSDHPYNLITKQVAAELNVQVIDLYKSSHALFSKLGEAGCAFMLYNPNSPDDVLHVSPMGAAWVSQLIATELPPELGPYLTQVFEALPRP